MWEEKTAGQALTTYVGIVGLRNVSKPLSCISLSKHLLICESPHLTRNSLLLSPIMGSGPHQLVSKLLTKLLVGHPLLTLYSSR